MRGKVKLIDSNGYTYNIKSRGVNVVYWQCSVRPKVNPCKALVIERGSSFNVVAMFTQTMGMTASDWPVFHVVKTSQTIDLFYLLQELL